ncbi:MAG: thioredoxin family protein [Tenuifilum sp.]|uniref:thioredoxin family protein n=1 Tax=Tenuifilum sp. TaxID=2760880 RepID=UPI001B5D66B4|nr:thioredoxin family protein [Bacteroidales bacterium]HOK60046.1 thioredoxin family protein [Tenuifilum sp.]MBP9028398.1 thioredoxin family protein [Bacteroidales bacterium]HOK84732.1 thioredoxin family protein [Tenuifilum sp.]HOU73801.1 thioredoxin family protein [Tenuifilum sp.]
MKRLVIYLTITAFFIAALSSNTFAQTKSQTSKTERKYKVTFIELGSVRCIPCQQMQPILKSVEEKYGKQVKVIFYDVWTDDGKQYAKKYNINLIPTQIFLDENGKEYFRHEGFFPENELIEVLKKKGVK